MQKYISFSEASLILGKNKHAPFLTELKEECDNELYITICGSKVGKEHTPHAPYDNTAIDAILSRCKPILLDQAQEYEIIFEDYILYQVRNESLCSFDPNEIRNGKYLIVFEKSKLLDYLPLVTDVRQFDDGTSYPECWKHYGIYTQRQVIDIVSQVEPKVLRKVNL